MVLKDNERLRCPVCGGEAFLATAHVAQDWELDSRGMFTACVNECIETVHEPDEEDLWTCKACGHEAPGKDFIVTA